MCGRGHGGMHGREHVVTERHVRYGGALWCRSLHEDILASAGSYRTRNVFL